MIPNEWLLLFLVNLSKKKSVKLCSDFPYNELDASHIKNSAEGDPQ